MNLESLALFGQGATVRGGGVEHIILVVRKENVKPLQAYLLRNAVLDVKASSGHVNVGGATLFTRVLKVSSMNLEVLSPLDPNSAGMLNILSQLSNAAMQMDIVPAAPQLALPRERTL